MKKMFLSVVGLLLFGAATAMASSELVIHLTKGTQRFVLLSEQPTITFEGENIVVKTKDNEFSYKMEDVNYFNYEQTSPTGIGEIQNNNGLKVTGDHIAFSGLPAGSKVMVYGVGGQLFITETADEEGNAFISLARLASGVYIVNANNISTKITKK